MIVCGKEIDEVDVTDVKKTSFSCYTNILVISIQQFSLTWFELGDSRPYLGRRRINISLDLPGNWSCNK